MDLIESSPKQMRAVLGRLLAIFGCGVLAMPSMAQTSEYNWVLAKGPQSAGAGTKLQTLIPQSGAPLARFDCVAQEGADNYAVFTLTANIGPLTPGAPAKIVFSAAQGSFDFDALAVDPETGGGIQGVTFSLTNDDPIWAALTQEPFIDYQVGDNAASRLDLGAGNGKLAEFSSLCKNTQAAAQTETKDQEQQPSNPEGQTVNAVRQGPDFGIYHTMTTRFRGPDMCLDVFNGGNRNNHTELRGCADFSGQYWLFTPTRSGSYRLTTMFRGDQMCLDIHNGGPRNNQPHLAPCANYSGQFWKVRAENGVYRLTTEFRGSGMCLDIFNGGPSNNMPELRPCANFTGQFWSIRPTDKVR